jgi:hypothetical protein
MEYISCISSISLRTPGFARESVIRDRFIDSRMALHKQTGKMVLVL